MLLLAGGVAAQAPQPGAQSPAELRQLAQQQSERLDCQQEVLGRPRGDGNGGGAGGSGVPVTPNAPPRESSGDGLRIDLGGGGGEIAVALFWVLLAAFVIAVLVAVVRRAGAAPLPAPKAARPVQVTAAVPAPVPAANEPLPDHVILAREGRYGEAIHALLLAALQLLVQALGRGLPREATGRDALRLARPLPEGGTSLGSLVRSVERCHFGGIAAMADDYEAAVGCFERWSEACRSKPS